MASRLTKSELIQVLSADPDGMKAADVLAKVGGAEAFEDLIDLLQNQRDPPDESWFGMRKSIIRALGEIGDSRAIVPLLRCYELYGALTNLMVQTLEEKGIQVPARFDSLELAVLYKDAGSPSLRQSTAFPAVVKMVSGTHFEAHQETEHFELQWQVFGCLVQNSVIEALAKIKAEGMNEVLANLLGQEREKSVCESIVLALGKLHDPRAIEGLGEYLFYFVSSSSWVADEVRRVIDDLASYPEERAKELLRQFCERCTDGTKREFRDLAASRIGYTPQTPVKKSGCFIATAAYGSDAMPQVILLREFRDTRLASCRMGRAVVALYERLSPPLAELIRERPACGWLVRVVILNRVVQILKGTS